MAAVVPIVAILLGRPERGAHAPERRDLEHRDVGGLGAHDQQGVLGPADRLVGGHRDVDAAAHRGELVDRRARLLDVLQPTGGAGEPPDRVDGAVDVPRTVGVDADLAARPTKAAAFRPFAEGRILRLDLLVRLLLRIGLPRNRRGQNQDDSEEGRK